MARLSRQQRLGVGALGVAVAATGAVAGIVDRGEPARSGDLCKQTLGALVCADTRVPYTNTDRGTSFTGGDGTTTEPLGPGQRRTVRLDNGCVAQVGVTDEGRPTGRIERC